MAESNGTRGAGIAKGGYKPKPFKNDGMVKIIAFVPSQIYGRIKDIADREDVQYSAVICHAITEYFKALDDE